MKRFLSCMAVLALTLPLVAQQTPPTMQAQPKRAPASPAETATGTIGSSMITIAYSSPRVKGREGQIFNQGGLIQRSHKEYPVWRAGANAATTMATTGDLKIGDVSVPKGTYTLFVDISNPDQWTLIISKKTGEWGLAYDPSQDLGRTKMEMSKPPQMVENLTWSVESNAIKLAWEDHVATVPVQAAQ